MNTKTTSTISARDNRDGFEVTFEHGRDSVAIGFYSAMGCRWGESAQISFFPRAKMRKFCEKFLAADSEVPSK